MDSDKITYASSRMWNEISGFGRNSLSNDSWKCKHAPLGVMASHPCFSLCVLLSRAVIVFICLVIDSKYGMALVSNAKVMGLIRRYPNIHHESTVSCFG